MARVFSSILLLVASWILIVLTDETPGYVGWQEALLTPVVIYAAWQAMRELVAWYRGEE